MEEKIKNEIEFYQLNKNSEIIPKLYRYDISKFKFDYMYEILEKVSGKSLYFSWPKMNEDEREKTIQKLVLALKNIHHTDVKPINSWSSKIKNEVKNKAIEYKSLFNQEDYLLILESLKLYDICLSDNHFAYLHNNLQFNNIIYNNGSLKLIDFEDALVAPIDFEFRKLYITQEEPWRYNNPLIENTEIYQNIFNYIKKYYKELGNIKYLDLRMLIYTIYEDMKLLDKYQTKELINNIIKNTQKLINLSKTYPKKLIEVPQKINYLSSPTRALRELIRRDEVIHTNNPLLNRAAYNAMIKEYNDSVAIDKGMNRNKIDAVDAVINAMSDAQYHDYDAPTLQDLLDTGEFGFGY